MASNSISQNTKRRTSAPEDRAVRPLGQVGSWQLVQRIATGQFAETYLAKPAATATDDSPCSYVVKQLRDEVCRAPHAIEMMQREAAVGHAVSHPHLVTVLDAHLDSAP